MRRSWTLTWATNCPSPSGDLDTSLEGAGCDAAVKGLDERTVRFISQKKGEPGSMLEWRLEAFRRWKTMELSTYFRINERRPAS